MKTPFFTGLIPDPRSEDEKKFDYKHEEFAGAPISVDPFGNAQIFNSAYPDEDQRQVGSCVPHGVGRALAIERDRQTNQGYERLSWTFAYRLRSNFPQPGCWLQDVLDTYRKAGAPLFTTLPDPATEEAATAVTLTPQEFVEASIFKGSNYVQFDVPNDINTIAQVAAQGKGVPILFYSTYDEWARQYPEIQAPSLKQFDSAAVVRHCVCVLPNSGFIQNGVKYVTVQDSAHFGARTIRYLSEKFVDARLYEGAYWVAPAVLGSGPMPSHTFTKVLRSGMNDPEVAFLQKLLVAEGFLRSDCVTGFFGGMTLAGLHAFQNKYAADILTPLGLDTPTDSFGLHCIAKANSLTKKK